MKRKKKTTNCHVTTLSQCVLWIHKLSRCATILLKHTIAGFLAENILVGFSNIYSEETVYKLNTWNNLEISNNILKSRLG